jgi:hypothetical protein
MPYVFQTKTKEGKPHPRWRFEFRDYRGRKKKCTGFTSKAQTLKYVRELEAREEAIRKGFREPPKPKIPDREFKAVAREYLNWGDSQGGRGGRPWGERHSMTRHRHLAWWQKRLGFSMFSEFDGCLPLVEAELRALQGKGLAGRTVAQYAESIGAFTKWCHTRHFIENDPLVALTGFDTTPHP